MKKFLNIFLSIILIILMLLVFPFCLIRKTTEFSSVMTSSYNRDTLIESDSKVDQYFLCQYSYLSYIDFVLSCNDSSVLESEDGFRFELKDESGNAVFEEYIPFNSLKDYFYRANIKKWLKKGRVYSYSISFDKAEFNDVFTLLYTGNAADDALGNTELYFNGNKLSGNMACVYGYGCPLNIKNIVYIDSVFIIIYLAVLMLINRDEKIFANNNKLQKVGKVFNKLDDILKKYKFIKILLFILEVIGISALLALISRNIAVDWDEAYSINMIRNNGISGIIKTTALDIHPPLYYILLHFWIKIFHDSFYAFKMMSAFITVLTIIFSSYYVNKNFGFKVMLLFNLIIGLGPNFLNYALNIRMYSLGSMFVLLSALMAYDIVKTRSEGKHSVIKWILFTLVSLSGVYSHYFTAIPYVIIFAYLMIALITLKDKKIYWFFISGAACVIGYLPWLFVMIKSFGREGVNDTVELAKLDWADLINWSFETNMIYSSLIPVILLGIGLIFVVFDKKRKLFDKLFLFMMAVIYPLSYIVCIFISAKNRHFYDNRYVFFSLAFVWLFIFIVYVQKNKAAFCFAFLMTALTVMSFYRHLWWFEVGTNGYMNDAYALMEQAKNEDVILYDFPTFDMLYSAHLPGVQFIDINEYDYTTNNQGYVYYISWREPNLNNESLFLHVDRIEDCGTMRLEYGVENVHLKKIYLK